MDSASELLRGLLLSLKSLRHVIATKQVWKEHKNSIVILVSLMLIIYSICLLFYIPVYITLYFTSFVYEPPLWFKEKTVVERASELLYNLTILIPMLTIFVTQYLLPNFAEGVFFASLRPRNPALAQMLEQIQPLGYWGIVRKKAARLMKLALFSFIAWPLSFIPVVGVLVIPSFQFYVTYKGKVFGFKISSLLALAFFFPFLKPHAWPFVQVMFGARALAIECLEPYFARFGYDKIRDFEKRNRALMLGFSLPFLLLMSVPVFGPLCWGAVQACAALLLLETIPM